MERTMDTLKNGRLRNNNQIACNREHSLHWYLLTNKIANGCEIKPKMPTIAPTPPSPSSPLVRSIVRMMERGLKIVSDQIDDINKVPRERSAINCLSLCLSHALHAHNAFVVPQELVSAADAENDTKHMNMLSVCVRASSSTAESTLPIKFV